MTATIAVLTDAASADYFFPLWHRYYGDLVGPAHLHVVTYAGLAHQFRAIELGSLWQLPFAYEEDRRATVISELVRTLLTTYDIVVRVDVDEILVPDLRRHADLVSFLRSMRTPYITARGFDVIQTIDDPPLDRASPILLEQRAYAYPNCSLNKTCATTIPLSWSAGFHGSSGYPMLGDLFMLHLKWIDAPQLLAWQHHMTDTMQTTPHQLAYYAPDSGRIQVHRQRMSMPPGGEGWDAMRRRAFSGRYLGQLHYNRQRGTWEPRHETEDVLIRLPDQLRGLL